MKESKNQIEVTELFESYIDLSARLDVLFDRFELSNEQSSNLYVKEVQRKMHRVKTTMSDVAQICHRYYSERLADHVVSLMR